MEIYSNCMGSFVIDNGKVVDSIPFEKPIESNILLEQGKETPEEAKLLKKHPKAELVRTRKSASVFLVSKDLPKMREISILVTREKIRQSVKDDQLIVQTSQGLDELDKAINLMVKRLREWYELYNPEFSNSISDHEKFVSLILTRSKTDLLRELKVKNTMGADLPKEDLDAIFLLGKQIKSMYELRHNEELYLDSMMRKVCPNIVAVAGTPIGAKLIALAGSLYRLSKFPASTVQLLGAEVALFRHLRNKKNRPPKFGVIHEHGLISRVPGKNKGKVARMLGDKIAIAAKVDYFKGKFVGKQLLEQIEKRMVKLR